jgi:hypothetical protein
MDRPDTASATGSSASRKRAAPTASPTTTPDPDRASVRQRDDKADLLAAANANAKLANPLRGLSVAELRDAGRGYALSRGITEPEDVRAFELGAVLAQLPEKWERVGGLEGGADEAELRVLEKEYGNKWSQPPLLYLVIVMCSTCAAVQGMVGVLGAKGEANRTRTRRWSTARSCFTASSLGLATRSRSATPGSSAWSTRRRTCAAPCSAAG